MVIYLGRFKPLFIDNEENYYLVKNAEDLSARVNESYWIVPTGPVCMKEEDLDVGL